jgi:outer membrane protein
MENSDMKIREQAPGKENVMKIPRVQMIFNMIFLVGIIACIVLVFTRNSKSSDGENGNRLKIGFVNSDSLMVHYDLFIDLKTELETETLKLREDLSQKEKSLQNQFLSYQQKMQTGNISYDDAKKTEEYLAAQQQQLMELGELYTNQIAEKEYAMTLRVLDSLNVVLAIINESENYDYILGYSQGAGILYANPRLEITDKVVEILNERYSKNKKTDDAN